MFFIISKLLAFIVAPVVWVTILLIWALLAKDPKRKRKILIATFIIFYFFSNSFIIDEFMRPYETPAIQESDLKGTYDVGIVLGGMIEYDPSFVRPQFNRAVDRLMQAITLYRDRKIKRILISGGSGSILEKNALESVILKDYLIKFGIPDSVILVEKYSKNTHENAVYSKQILDSLHTQGRYLLITSGFHMPRSLKCFKKVGMEVTHIVPTDIPGPVNLYSTMYSFLQQVHLMNGMFCCMNGSGTLRIRL